MADAVAAASVEPTTGQSGGADSGDPTSFAESVIQALFALPSADPLTSSPSTPVITTTASTSGGGTSPSAAMSETEVTEFEPRSAAAAAAAATPIGHLPALAVTEIPGGGAKVRDRRVQYNSDKLFDDDDDENDCEVSGAAYSGNYQHNFKLLLVGQAGVGKSSALKSLMENRAIGPCDGVPTTIGVDFNFYRVNRHKRQWKFQIWDTAGQEKFRSITLSYYRDAHGVIGVVDMFQLQEEMGRMDMNNVETAMSSKQMADAYAAKVFQRVFGDAFASNDTRRVDRIIFEELVKQPLFLLMGNKTDKLVQEPSDLPIRNSLKELCEARGGRFYDTSVQQGINVKRAFGQLMLDLIGVCLEHERLNGRRQMAASLSLDIGAGFNSPATTPHVNFLRIVPDTQDSYDERARANMQCKC